MRYHFILTRIAVILTRVAVILTKVAVIKKNLNNKSVRMWRNWDPSTLLVER